MTLYHTNTIFKLIRKVNECFTRGGFFAVAVKAQVCVPGTAHVL
jgi:hypothetical protein